MSAVSQFLTQYILQPRPFICGGCGWWVPDLYDTDEHCNHDTLIWNPSQATIDFGLDLRKRHTANV
jgi:hypothetical protein